MQLPAVRTSVCGLSSTRLYTCDGGGEGRSGPGARRRPAPPLTAGAYFGCVHLLVVRLEALLDQLLLLLARQLLEVALRAALVLNAITRTIASVPMVDVASTQMDLGF